MILELLPLEEWPRPATDLVSAATDVPAELAARTVAGVVRQAPEYGLVVELSLGSVNALEALARSTPGFLWLADLIRETIEAEEQERRDEPPPAPPEWPRLERDFYDLY